MQENVLKYNNQVEYDGNAYIDEKCMPTEDCSGLTDLSRSEIFGTMKVTVLSDETMHGDLTHYIFKDENWELDELTAEIIDDEFINCVRFTALEDNSKLGLNKISTQQSLEYSLDKDIPDSWVDFTTAVTITLQSGETAYVRGILSGNNTNSDYTQFKMPSGTFSVEGNINSLWNYRRLNARLFDYCGYMLFNDCTGLINIDNLTLPSLTLSKSCYYRIFYNCKFTTVPSNLLPATNLAPYCYAGAFFKCENLTNVPVLPALTLKEYCYWGLFGQCVSLVTVPSNLFPSTTLADYCYYDMFDSCTSLTTVPELPATVLTEHCYYGLFYKCTSLTSIPSNLLQAKVLAKGCYKCMFQECVNLTTAPDLPATALSEECYTVMFHNCSKLTTAPELPATTLVDGCYSQMFFKCNKLNYIKCLAKNGINQNDSTYYWVSGVPQVATSTFIKARNASWPTGNNGIPNNWQVITEGDSQTSGNPTPH